MDRRTFLAAGATALGSALAGCASGTERGYDVGMVSNGFLVDTDDGVPADAPEWVPRSAPTLQVQAGETVIWENTGSRIHTVTAATRAHARAKVMMGSAEDVEDVRAMRLPEDARFFASGGFDGEIAAVESFLEDLSGGGAIPPGEHYAHTFHAPGWYHYYCIPHEPAGMIGNVHVVE
ncbi:MAG: plastocyanin/azurin family copper-binding protein [Halanaeroarchaeum sp.]